MFKAASLRAALIAAAAAILASGCERAPEAEGDGPKMEFVRIPAGSFHMGSPPTEQGRDDNEGPVREVRITKPFYMGKYEVTQAQWKAVMGTTLGEIHARGYPWLVKGEGPEHPMYDVAWDQAVEFCKRLGRKFRLPTEAEWEYACRAGSRTRFYYGDDPNYSQLDQHAWYYGKSDNETHPVGRKQANEWGLYDMYGNLSEWCQDRYPIKEGYKNAGNVDPMLPATNDWLHVARGGSWLDKPDDCRSASRNLPRWPDSLGFRVVFTGKVRGDSAVLQVALPEKPAKVSAAPEQDGRDQSPGGWVVSGVFRDEAGMPIDDLHTNILPPQYGYPRTYAGGEFEAYAFPRKSEQGEFKGRLMARHMPRNLVAIRTINRDARTIDVNLAPGVIVTGQVVGSDGKTLGNTRIMVELQDSDWKSILTPLTLESDDGGRFEVRALPLGYEYILSTRSRGYREGRIEVHPDDVGDNRVVAISIVLARGEFSVSGTVIDPNGKPIADAHVFCYGKNQPRCDASTDADGRFKIDGIFKGRVTVQAQAHGLYDLAETEAGATDVRIVPTKKAAAPPKGRACFPGETGVWVDGELVPISRVARGRTVGHVERIEEHAGAFECRVILLDSGNRISVVESHCFMLDCGRWIAAQELRAGQRLKTVTGTVGIKSVAIRPTLYTGKVYNLKIKNSDQYAVGKDGVIVRDY